MVRAHPTVPTKSITCQKTVEARPYRGYQLATMLLGTRLAYPRDEIRFHSIIQADVARLASQIPRYPFSAVPPIVAIAPFPAPNSRNFTRNLLATDGLDPVDGFGALRCCGSDAFPELSDVVWGQPVRLVSLKLERRVLCKTCLCLRMVAATRPLARFRGEMPQSCESYDGSLRKPLRKFHCVLIDRSISIVEIDVGQLFCAT